MKLINGNKKKLLKIVSLFAAIIIWVFITHSEDPLIDFSLNSLDVSIVGETALNDRGLMVINKAQIPDTSVKIRGRRGDLISVMDNIIASVDVSQITESGVYELRSYVEIPSNAVYISKGNNKPIPIEVAVIEEKTVPVKVNRINANKNTEFVVECVPLRSELTIKGENGDIEHIDHISLDVDVSQMVEDSTGVYEIIYEDANNAEVLPINDIINPFAKMEVASFVYDKKEIDVEIVIPDKIKRDYSVEVIEQLDKKIIAGIRNEEANEITKVLARLDAQIIEQGTKEYNFVIDAQEGLYIPEESSSVRVILESHANEERDVWVPVKVINTKGIDYKLDNESVKVTISGPKDKLIADNLTAEIDLDSIENIKENNSCEVVITSTQSDVRIESEKIYMNVQIIS